MNELQAVYGVINRLWKWFKTDSQTITVSDDWVKEEIEKCNNFLNEYQSSPIYEFVKEMSLTILHELERLWKEKEKEEGKW